VPVSPASSSLDNFSDICWANTRAETVFVPRDAHFFDLSARQMFAIAKKCGICRQEIDLLLPILVK